MIIEDELVEADGPSAAAPSRLPLVFGAVIAVALLLTAGTVGWLVRGDGGSGTTVGASSVDAGFSRDMMTHHEQAVTMASYTRDHTTDPSVKLLAYDIEDEQAREIGRMTGWLDSWNLPVTDSTQPVMAWMGGSDHLGADGLMPGVATPEQMSKLQTLTGKQLDITFLQLMIRHHQGGIPMARYAAQHASEPYVRDAAQKMVTAQSNQVIAMGQLLRQLGGQELPAPS